MKPKFWYPMVSAVVLLAVTACGGGSSGGGSSPTAPTPPTPPPPPTALTTLATGQFTVMAGDFHDTFSVGHTMPASLGATAGRRLEVRLRDLGRPGQTCGSEHPLSGCVTVDWSDFQGTPNVPPNGVFDNRLEIQLASGTRTYYLSETLALADAPDPYSDT